MSDPNDLKPPESDAPSRSTSPKPVGMSIKERMAMFNKQAESASAPASKQPPPAIGRKPMNWQPTSERKVSSGEGKSGLSANDAASSISRPGGSLKDRMAALQGAFGSATAPSPSPKSETAPKPLKQSEDVKSPIEESLLQQAPSEAVKSPPAEAPQDVAQGAEPEQDAEQTEKPADDDAEVDEAEKERLKRQEIAARMAKLGGMRLGGPPMAAPVAKKPEAAQEPQSQPESSTEVPQDVPAPAEASDEAQHEQKQEPEQDIPAPEDTTPLQASQVPEASPTEVEATQPKQEVAAEPVAKEAKEPVEELSDQPTSMKAPPLARRAKPPRRRTPQTQVQTSDLNEASAVPLPETPATEQPLHDQNAAVEEEKMQEASQEPAQEPVQELAAADDEDHPGSEHLHRFSPPKSPEEAPTSEQSTEDRRISIATALVDKPTPLNTAIEHFHSPLDKDETPVETPRSEIDPASPFPIAQPSFPVADVAKEDKEGESEAALHAVPPQNVATIDDDVDSSEPSDEYEPIDKKGKGRSTSFTSAFLGRTDKPLATPGVEATHKDIPQHIEDSFEHRLEEESKKAAAEEEAEAEASALAAAVDDDVREDVSEAPPLPAGKPIVEDKEEAKAIEPVPESDTEESQAAPAEIDEASAGPTNFAAEEAQAPAPVSEEQAAPSNAKDSITERMAKISMAGGFKFGPAPPVLNKPMQQAEDEKEDADEQSVDVEETKAKEEAASDSVTADDDKKSISEDPVEETTDLQEKTQPTEPEVEAQEPEETEAERRARIAKRLAASGALRPVFGGAPEQASAPPVPQPPPAKKEVADEFDEEASNATDSDDDDMKKFMEGVHKESSKLDEMSEAGDSVKQVDDDDVESPAATSQDKRQSIPLPSRDLPPVTADLPEPSEGVNPAEAEPVLESETELPPPIPSRQSVASPSAPSRSVPGLPQSPPKRTMPSAPPIKTDVGGEAASAETSPALASPPIRSVPAPPSATSPTSQRPPIPRKRPSVSSQHSANRSSIGSILDIASSPLDQPHKRSSAHFSPESPQVAEEVGQDVNEEDNAAERRRNITERLAASGGIRPLIGGMPQPPSRSIPQPAEEPVEPTEELSEKPAADDEETPEAEAERRARIAKKLAMQGTIKPIFGGMQQTHEPAPQESESAVEDTSPPQLTVEGQHLEAPQSDDLPPPVPRQRPRSFLSRPTSMISPPKSPPPTSPPPNPPAAPPSRQLPKLEPPKQAQAQSAWYGEEDTDDEKRQSSGEFVHVPSRTMSATTPKTERESFEFVAAPKEKELQPAERDAQPSSPGKSPTGPRPIGKHIYTHDELVQLSHSLGRKISEFTKAQFELSKNMPIADGTSLGFITETLAFCNAVSDPDSWSFGHLVHSQNAQGILKRLDDPRAGDVLVLKHAEFKGRKALGNYKATFGANGPQVAFVTEYDLKKGKVSAVQTSSQPNHYPTLENISIKFGDLKDGSFDIFRPVPLS